MVKSKNQKEEQMEDRYTIKEIKKEIKWQKEEIVRIKAVKKLATNDIKENRDVDINKEIIEEYDEELKVANSNIDILNKLLNKLEK